MLDVAEIQSLLSKLCIDLGFCLPQEEENALLENSPNDVDDFTDAVFLAEGINPQYAERNLYRRVRQVIAEAFQQHHDRVYAEEITSPHDGFN